MSTPLINAISLDYSTAFDTVQHSSLLDKMAQLDMPDEVYNGLVSFRQRMMHRMSGLTELMEKTTTSRI